MTKKGAVFAWLVCGLGALFYCYEYYLRILPSVMTQDLMHIFNIDAAMFGNLIAFYYYAYTPMQLPVGVMMDRFGPRRLLVFAALVCTLGTYLFAQHYLWVAQVGRFLVGFGSAFAFVGVLKLASLWLPPSRFGMIAGLATTLGMLGAMGGDILLAELVNSLGSVVTLYVSAIAGVVIMLVIWWAIPEQHIATDAHVSHPTISFQRLLLDVFALFRKPQMWLVGLVGFLLYLSLSAFAESWGVAYLIRAHNLSNSEATRTVSMVFLGWAIGGPLFGWISDRLANRCLPLVIGSIGGAIIFSIMLFIPFHNIYTLIILLFLFGVFSSAEVLIFPIAHESNAKHLAGTAIAVTNMLVMAGGVLFQPLIGWFLNVLAGHRVMELSSFSASDFQRTMLVVPISFVLAAILMFFVKETHGKGPNR